MMMTFQDIYLDGIPEPMDTQFSFEPDVFSQIAYKKMYQWIIYYWGIKNSKITKANKKQSQRDVAGDKMLILYNKMVCGTSRLSNKNVIREMWNGKMQNM